jgi:hypothetical protein
MPTDHSCIRDDGGTPNRHCDACDAERAQVDAVRTAPTGPVAPIDLSALDPGIRDVVRRIREAGFETTDSGDGVSKSADWYASGEAIPFPHVAVETTPGWMVSDAHQLAELLGDGWNVEATYATHDQVASLFARTLDPREIDAADPDDVEEGR